MDSPNSAPQTHWAPDGGFFLDVEQQNHEPGGGADGEKGKPASAMALSEHELRELRGRHNFRCHYSLEETRGFNW